MTDGASLAPPKFTVLVSEAAPLVVHCAHVERRHCLTPSKAWREMIRLVYQLPFSALTSVSSCLPDPELKGEASNGVFQEHIARSMSSLQARARKRREFDPGSHRFCLDVIFDAAGLKLDVGSN